MLVVVMGPLPVRPTFFLQVKQRLFLGLGGSGAPASSAPVAGVGEATGWVSTAGRDKTYAPHFIQNDTSKYDILFVSTSQNHMQCNDAHV